MKIPFSPPDISQKEIDAVTEALRSGWITTGPRTKELEKRLKAYTGSDRVICLNSATAAMEMALRLLDVGPGDEVITTAYTYTASASVIHHVGAKIVLVDTKADSFEMDPEQLSRAITPATKVIIPVDIAGKMADYDRLIPAIEEKKHLYSPKNDLQRLFDRPVILSDSAHGIGASYKGQKSGSVADFTAFSFHAVKNLTTAGGGALCWKAREGLDSDEIYRRLNLLCLHGQSKDALAKVGLGAWEYDILSLAYKNNMTDIAAAMGLAQLERYDGLVARRREIVRRYDEAFLPLGITTRDHFEDGYFSNCHLYLSRVPDCDADRRNRLIIYMAEQGISCNVHYKPLPLLTAYKNLGFQIADYPNALAQFSNEITLPLHTLLTNEEVDYVIENFIKALDVVK